MLVSLTARQISLIGEAIANATGNTVHFDAGEEEELRAITTLLADALHPSARQVPSGGL